MVLFPMPFGPYLMFRDERRREMCASVMLLQSVIEMAYSRGSSSSCAWVSVFWDATVRNLSDAGAAASRISTDLERLRRLSRGQPVWGQEPTWKIRELQESRSLRGFP